MIFVAVCESGFFTLNSYFKVVRRELIIRRVHCDSLHRTKQSIHSVMLQSNNLITRFIYAHQNVCTTATYRFGGLNYERVQIMIFPKLFV